MPMKIVVSLFGSAWLSIKRLSSRDWTRLAWEELMKGKKFVENAGSTVTNDYFTV